MSQEVLITLGAIFGIIAGGVLVLIIDLFINLTNKKYIEKNTRVLASEEQKQIDELLHLKLIMLRVDKNIYNEINLIANKIGIIDVAYIRILLELHLKDTKHQQELEEYIKEQQRT